MGGDFHGSISTKDKLIVGERAQIHANIKAGKIEVYGAIFGNVESARRLHLHSGGSIVGDIRTPELVIEAGGMFDGKRRGRIRIGNHSIIQKGMAGALVVPARYSGTRFRSATVPDLGERRRTNASTL